MQLGGSYIGPSEQMRKKEEEARRKVQETENPAIFLKTKITTPLKEEVADKK